MVTTKSVLIIGGSGFIGTHLALKLRENYKVFTTYNTQYLPIAGVTAIPMSLQSRNWIKRVVYTAHPEVIIYVAGKNDVEWAENNSRMAENVHTAGPATVSNVAEILQPKFIFLSNCYAFDGQHGNYHEADITLPQTNLGRAKVGGENFIRGKSLNYTIVRASHVFGRGNIRNRSFLDRLRMSLDRGEKVELPTTELHSWVPIGGLTDLIARLVDSGPRNKVFHYGGLTKVTEFEFGKLFAKRFGYDPNLILPKRYGNLMTDKPIYDYSLNCSQVVETLKVKPLLLEEGFDLFENELIAGL